MPVCPVHGASGALTWAVSIWKDTASLCLSRPEVAWAQTGFLPSLDKPVRISGDRLRVLWQWFLLASDWGVGIGNGIPGRSCCFFRNQAVLRVSVHCFSGLMTWETLVSSSWSRPTSRRAVSCYISSFPIPFMYPSSRTQVWEPSRWKSWLSHSSLWSDSPLMKLFLVLRKAQLNSTLVSGCTQTSVHQPLCTG